MMEWKEFFGLKPQPQDREIPEAARINKHHPARKGRNDFIQGNS